MTTKKSTKSISSKYGTTTKKKLETYCYCATVVSSARPDYHEQVSELEKIGRDCFTWFACIEHLPDKHIDDDSDHYVHTHFLFYSKTPLRPCDIDKRFVSVFPASSHMVLYIGSGSGYGRYLLHKRNPEKIQYDTSDLRTTSLDFYLKLTRDSSCDSMSLWEDYKRLRVGAITPEEFIDRYRADLATMPLYQRFSMFAKIFDTCKYTYLRSQSLDFSSESCPPHSEVNGATVTTESLGIENFNIKEVKEL